MRVDVDSLGTFNRLAHEGAQRATDSMARMTGIDATVDVTSISLIDRTEIGEELAGREFVGVRFGFEGGLSGDSVLVFDQDSGDEIASALLDGVDDPDLARSGVAEIGNVMMSGFIDGWADFLGTSIDHTPPEYIEGSGPHVLPADDDVDGSDQLFVFRSEIEWLGESVQFYIYMLPDREPLVERMADHAGADDAIPIEKLEVFNSMTRRGAQTAAGNVEAMTGLETDAEVTRVSFVPIEDVPRRVGTEPRVGTVVEFTGVPSGYLLVLFDESSAVTVAEALMPVGTDGEELTDQHRAAIKELGNIMTSGFVDGWANVLQRSVEHTPPRLVHDMGRAIVDPLAARLGQHQRHAFTIESTMRTDDLSFACEIHALPDEAELRRALDELLVERADQTEASVEGLFEQ